MISLPLRCHPSPCPQSWGGVTVSPLHRWKGSLRLRGAGLTPSHPGSQQSLDWARSPLGPHALLHGDPGTSSAQLEQMPKLSALLCLPLPCSLCGGGPRLLWAPGLPPLPSSPPQPLFTALFISVSSAMCHPKSSHLPCLPGSTSQPPTV